MKQCSKCKIIKEDEDFHKRTNRASGLHSSCKDCCKIYKKLNRKVYSEYSRNYDLKKSYGINHSDYLILLKSQDDCCAICKKNIEDIKMSSKKHYCIDHCHNSGKIRGVLCDKCNRGIGLLGDNVNTLQNAINYLNK